MPKSNPYESLNNRNFWKTGVVQPGPVFLENIHTPKWSIQKTDSIMTMGSCFAHHIARQLKPRGYLLPSYDNEEMIKDHHFTANYGNIYTVRQATQLLAECLGRQERSEVFWQTNDGFVDPLRPNAFVEPFKDVKTLINSRRKHLEAVRSAVSDFDIFIFTLGLTEAWTTKKCGTVFPTAPGIIGGKFDPDVHRFQNFSFDEIRDDLNLLIESIGEIRNGVDFRMLLTVSPVPLTATAEDRHVLVSSTASKAKLRAVVDEFVSSKEFIDYFPSYEIVNNPTQISQAFEKNWREVTDQTVNDVIKKFIDAYENKTPLLTKAPSKIRAEFIEDLHDVECEEALLEHFAGKIDNQGTINSDAETIIFGNSHIIELNKTLSEKALNQSQIVPANFLSDSWQDELFEHQFRRFTFSKPRHSEVYVPNANRLLICGFGLFGNGLAHCLGEVKPGFIGCRGVDISPQINPNQFDVKQFRTKAQKLIGSRLRIVDRALARSNFTHVLWLFEPPMPQRAARFRYGSGILKGHFFNELSSIYSEIFKEEKEMLTSSIQFIEIDSNTITSKGFTKNKYAKKNGGVWDVHPTASFFNANKIEEKLFELGCFTN